jgi:hypothetical protein
MFPIPRDNFRSLVANLIIEKLLKLCKLILVRVFHEGWLFNSNREKKGLSGIKMISILPWLLAMFSRLATSCLRHLSEMAVMEM